MLPSNLGVAELLIILVLAVLIFGPGRIGKLGAELGKGIGGFKQAMNVTDDATEETD